MIKDDLAPVIRANMSVDDEGPCEMEGYCIDGFTREQPSERYIDIFGRAGASIEDWNRMEISTAWEVQSDPAILTYEVFKAIFMASVACWDPGLCTARPNDLIPYQQTGRFHEAWMVYVPPHLASNVEPLDILVVEKMPNGGLFLAATTETFKVVNPVHLDGAFRIGRATRHLNAGGGAD